MSTTIRPEVSEKNRYWIDRHRYYELKHFCMQYPIWRESYLTLIKYPNSWSDDVPVVETHDGDDPVSTFADMRVYYARRMSMIEQAARKTDEVLAKYLIKAITEGISYDILRVQTDIPCSKDTYYDLYRRFFWILDQIRQ